MQRKQSARESPTVGRGLTFMVGKTGLEEAERRVGHRPEKEAYHRRSTHTGALDWRWRWRRRVCTQLF